MRVLLATDFSAKAEDARSLVDSFALPEGSRIRLVHAIESEPTAMAFAPYTITNWSEEIEKEMRAELERVAVTLRRPQRTVDIALAFGRAPDVIVKAAAEFSADLLVIGSRGRGGITSAVLGSVSAEVVDRARCPVLIARRPEATRIVLADDGSPNAAAAARLVAEMPVLRALPVRVVSVVDAPLPISMGGDVEAPTAASVAIRSYYDETLPALRKTHERYARERCDALAGLGLAASYEIREGDAAAQIVEAARATGADLVVIGTRGQTGLTRLVLGSVARGVVFHAPCSVLVTRSNARAASPRANGGKARERVPVERFARG